MTTQHKTNAKIIEEMMIERAGRSFLDSGSHYGYQNDIRVKNNFTEQSKATLDKDGYRKSLYHFLCSVAEIDHEKNDAFMEFAKAHPDESNYDIFHLWLNENGYKLKEEIWTANGEHAYDSEWIIYELYYPDERLYGSAVASHNGCDTRGGYALPRIMCNIWEDFFYGSDHYIKCNVCGHVLESYDAYSWNIHGAYGNGAIQLSDIYVEELNAHACMKCQNGVYTA